MSDYLLGLVTLPAIATLGFAVLAAWVKAIEALDAHWGITFEVKWRRGVEKISDYTLRRDIWWERPFGPIFIGGWYREPPTYMEPSRRLVNRWIGFGRIDGPCWMVFLSRDLGAAPTTPAETGGGK